MRHFLPLLLCGVMSSAAIAAETAEVPPPPPLHADDQAPEDEPEVTIKKEENQTVEEYRAGGRLYMIKITPKHGKPYYLVDDRGDGKFSRQESLDSGVRVPSWIIHRF